MAPSLTYPRHLRLVKKRDFERVYREGARVRGATLLVVAAPNGLAHPRLGLSVGRAIWKSAVARNRVRRIFREAFRLSQHELPAGFDLILIPGAPKLVPTLEATRRELVQLAEKARLRGPRAPRARGGPAGRAAERPAGEGRG